ncbi:SDR family oxidoreductase [Corynebacterium sp. CCM 9204]|uniref:SDR family oxidoreductase n=1 Tax=Corynebacterium sp. CCM 9204 TaxID=3057616 RepID=UPI003523436D
MRYGPVKGRPHHRCSRRGGIGFAVASRLAARGFDLVLAHHAPHDADQPWGADDVDAVVSAIRDRLEPGRRVEAFGGDLAEPDAPTRLVGEARTAFGHVDVLVANHARSGGDGPLLEQTSASLDDHWAVNARSTLLLCKEFAAQHDGRSGGRIVMMTSGQNLGPMPGEVAYGAAKAALVGILATVAHELAPRGITVNCVNPGPIDTDSYVTDELRQMLADRFPFGRWGEPDDPTRLIDWLVSDDGRWLTGQVINSEGGFIR